jgi:hypothetical protein
MLEERVESVRHYRQARERQARLLQRGLPLGTSGHVSWPRDDLHER